MMNGESILQKVSAMTKQTTELIQQTPSAKSQMPIQQTLSDELEPTCKPIGQTLPARLSWSHYERLMRVDDEVARKWYMREASEQMWSVRTLNRNINTYTLIKVCTQK